MRDRLERAFGVTPTGFYATTEGVWGARFTTPPAEDTDYWVTRVG